MHLSTPVASSSSSSIFADLIALGSLINGRGTVLRQCSVRSRPALIDAAERSGPQNTFSPAGHFSSLRLGNLLVSSAAHDPCDRVFGYPVSKCDLGIGL